MLNPLNRTCLGQWIVRSHVRRVFIAYVLLHPWVLFEQGAV